MKALFDILTKPIKTRLRILGIHRLRKSMKCYEIKRSWTSYRGCFIGNYYDSQVMARTPMEAVYRLRKRKWAVNLPRPKPHINRKFASYKVHEVGKPFNDKYLFYL